MKAKKISPEDGTWEPGEAVQERIKRQERGEEEPPTEEEFKGVLNNSKIPKPKDHAD